MADDSIATKREKLKRKEHREWHAWTRSVRRSVERLWRRETVAAVVLALLKALAVIALPFLVYVRAAVFLYRHGAHPWIAILLSAILTLGVVAGFLVLIARRF